MIRFCSASRWMSFTYNCCLLLCLVIMIGTTVVAGGCCCHRIVFFNCLLTFEPRRDFFWQRTTLLFEDWMTCVGLDIAMIDVGGYFHFLLENW